MRSRRRHAVTRGGAYPSATPTGRDAATCDASLAHLSLGDPQFLGIEVTIHLVATIPDSRGRAALELADELGLSRSQLIDEALTRFLHAVLEARRGRRLVSIEVGGRGPVCEMATPTLAALEWVQKPEKLELPPEAVARSRARRRACATGRATERCGQAIGSMSESAHVAVPVKPSDTA